MTGTLRVVVLALALAACGGESQPRSGGDEVPLAAAGSGCEQADSSVATLAVLDYITTAVPFPQRFLHAIGTDSALPDDGLKVLQAKGPTFYYAGSDAAKAKLRDKLENDGPFATLLVVMRSQDHSADGQREAITLAGHYVSNKDHGKELEPRTYQYRCTEGHWQRLDNSPDPIQ